MTRLFCVAVVLAGCAVTLTVGCGGSTMAKVTGDGGSGDDAKRDTSSGDAALAPEVVPADIRIANPDLPFSFDVPDTNTSRDTIAFRDAQRDLPAPNPDTGLDLPSVLLDAEIDIPFGGSGGAGGQRQDATATGGGGAGGTIGGGITGTGGTGTGGTGTGGTTRMGGAGSGGTTSTGTDAGTCSGARWLADESRSPLTLSFGSGADFPQFAAVDTSSGYARFLYGPSAGWGTSIILTPSFWTSDGTYHQGTPIDVQTHIECDHIQLALSGSIAGLAFTGTLWIDPPAANQLIAHVEMTTTGMVALSGDHPAEAFKPVMFSTMHESDTIWDASSLIIGNNSYAIPLAGWIVPSPFSATHFVLVGGTSTWKTNAPTVAIDLSGVSTSQVTGWITQSSDPNDDNGSLWAATSHVIPSWSYDITVTQAPATQ